MGYNSYRKEALGQSEPFLDFQERLARVAPINRPVLLLGERGTGKELAASRLHFLSKRWEGPFVTLNCATLSPTLIESELFGYEVGAFTGAGSRKTGRFESADGGTLFLDEIGSIPIEAQEKILRVVEYGTFERVGSSSPIGVDVRIVGATNVDLAAQAEMNKFKKDLLDRLSFEVLFLPPLRYREEDIMLLANHFATRMSFELGREEIAQFSPKAESALEDHGWEGNIRELKNVVERAVYRTNGEVIEEVVFDPFISPYASLHGSSLNPEKEIPVPVSAPLSLKEAVTELEKKMIIEALDRNQHNQRRAADYLELTYDQFRGKLRKHGKSFTE